MTTNRAALETKISEAEQAIEGWREEIRKIDTMPPEYRIADMIHDAQCTGNHTDFCGYFYESWDNIGSTRSRYLIKAKSLMNVADEESIPFIIAALKS